MVRGGAMSGNTVNLTFDLEGPGTPEDCYLLDFTGTWSITAKGKNGLIGTFSNLRKEFWVHAGFTADVTVTGGTGGYQGWTGAGTLTGTMTSKNCELPDAIEMTFRVDIVPPA
jgi:hypothetical protein